jgi:hypothetical protein
MLMRLSAMTPRPPQRSIPSNFSSFSTPPIPAHTAIKLILDNHSAHISKETRAWAAEQPVHRSEFTFTPKHGS